MSTRAISLLILGLASSGCGSTEDKRIEGTQPGDCTDRADNDADGDFDCDDAGCEGSPDCGEEADTDTDTDTDTDSDCSDDAAPDVDWLEVGPYAAGWQVYEGVSMLRDTPLTRQSVVYYPASEAGEDAAPQPSSEGYPVVFFEHAGGSHYLNYATVFSFLASHGLVIVSTDHTEVDSSMSWGVTDWWDSHDILFTDTIGEFQSWNETVDHPYAGMMNFDRMGLAGHSHGSALMTMQDLGPISALASLSVRGVALLAPCPDVPISSYQETYGGMAPLQVIYGSRDQDGCVAYGQSIAIFEAGAQPSHFIHLPGGSHYGFTDEGDLRDATITRDDHRLTASAGWLAWWKYTLEDDMRALPYLRGDRALLPGGPPVHTQFRERAPLAVDRFSEADETVTTVEEVSAIVGIDGQTFINSFLSDTFVDTAAGVDLVTAEIAALIDGTPRPARVLFFIDDALGTDVYGLALAELEGSLDLTLTQATSHADFAESISAGEWDLIIAATQTGSASDEHPYDTPLADWICDGGKAIVSDYRISSSGAARILECSGTGFGTLYNFETMTSDSSLFEGSISLESPGWGYFSVGLDDGEATRFAHTTSELETTTGLAPNALGHTPEHSGLDAVGSEWMLNDSRGVYHPSWATSLSWSSPGGHYRHVLDPDGGLDIGDYEVLSFRIMQRHDDARNDGEPIDLHIRLTDADARTAAIALSAAAQGALRPNPAVGAGTEDKSVYETYRLPLSAFTDAAADLDLSHIESVDWVFDLTETGAVTIDDVVFARAGLCE